MYFEAVKDALTELGLNFDAIQDRTALRMGVTGENGSWNVIADVKEEQGIIIFYSIATTNVPAKARAAAAEYLTRANYGLMVGNFEIDFRDGEVRYKTSICVQPDLLTENMVRHLFGFSVTTMDHYLPGLMAVSYGGQDPETAIRELEG